MQLRAESCYRALRARDARFDGRFFTGVVTTGVFCRPICPARTPLPSSCRFFSSAAEALAAGFRPCLRCRPEAAPGAPIWRGTGAIVTRALRLVAAGEVQEIGLAALAERLGVTDRHLRRLFLRHLGVSPHQALTAHRLLLARRLLREGGLSVTATAAAAGYGSVRRLQAAFRRALDASPSEFRSGRSQGGGEVELELAFRPPFDWQALMAFFAGRAVPGVEVVEPQRYWRTVRVGECRGEIEVRPELERRRLRARLRLTDLRALTPAVERLRRVFDLEADPEAVSEALSADPRLAPLVAARPGLRLPGAWDGFEAAVRAVLGQQVTPRGAATLAGRLAALCGEAAGQPGFYYFPTAEAVAAADLARVGLTRARAAAVRSLAEAVAQDRLRLGLDRDPREAAADLRKLPGIGQWTAEYVALRAFSDPDAFPPGDLALVRRFGGDSRALDRAAQAWSPWRAYAAMYLWTPPPALELETMEKTA